MKYLVKFIIFCCFYVIIDTFELGVERKFSFINDVSMNDLKAKDKSFGYRIAGTSTISSIWENTNDGILLKFKVENPKLLLQKQQGDEIIYKEKKSILDEYKDLTLYALRQDGIFKNLYLPKTKDSSVDNFLKGFVSLFQYQISDNNESTTEEDVSGICSVSYLTQSSTQVMKFKTECFNEFESRQRPEKLLGVHDRSTRVNLITFKSDGKLESVHGTDHHRFDVNAYSDIGLSVGSLYFVESKGEEVQCEVIKKEKLSEVLKDFGGLKETTLALEKQTRNVDGSLVKLIKENLENLANEFVGKSSSSKTLLDLLEISRISKVEDFTRILKAKSTKEHRGQLMDLLAAVQTVDSHEAFRKNMNFTNDDDFGLIERYLTALAVGAKPEETVIRDLLDLLIKNEVENEKLKDTLIQTVSSMANKFAHRFNEDFESRIVMDVKNYVLKSINECEEDDCKVKFIRGLGNIQSPDTMDKIFKFVTDYPYQVSVAAMKAFRKFDKSYLGDDWKVKMKNIFLQLKKKYDSSARTIALDIYMGFELSPSEVGELIDFFDSNDSSYEVKQYLLQKLRLQAEKCPAFNEMLQTQLKNNEKVNNWNKFGSVRGLSTVLQREFSKHPAMNSSLVSVQEMKSGVLKRGNVDLMLRSKDEEMSLFTLGLFAGGLNSFITSTDEVDPDEDTTAIAGMELSIQNIQMRPLTFFKGQGELMGHVWSGTASEPTSAYRGITLLQDFQKTFSLNNGALLDVTITGAMSIDLNGKIEISLWYKNANSEVIQNIGTALKVKASVSSPLAGIILESELFEEPKINLSSKISFATKTALCMQLSQPNSEFIYRNKRSVDVLGKKSRNIFQGQMKLRSNLPGSTHVLNRKNTEMCNEILQ